MEEHTLMLLSLSVKLLMLLRITETICNFRFHLIVETMQFIWVPSTWDLQSVNQQESSSILDQSTWPSLVCFAMTRQLATTNLRSMTLFPAASSKEIKPTRDARPWLMICTSLSQTRFFPRLHPSSPTDLPSSKVSYGKITLASSH